MAVTFTWDETGPSDSSLAGKAPAHFESLLEKISAGLGTEVVYWPGTAGGSLTSSGELRPGGTRWFEGPTSESSNPATFTHEGKGFWDSTLSRLYIYDSDGTWDVAARTRVTHINKPPSRSVWYVERGSWTTNANVGVQNTAFTGSYAVAPTVFLSLSAVSATIAVSSVSTGGFNSAFSIWGATPGSTFTGYWYSLATTTARV